MELTEDRIRQIVWEELTKGSVLMLDAVDKGPSYKELAEAFLRGFREVPPSTSSAMTSEAGSYSE